MQARIPYLHVKLFAFCVLCSRRAGPIFWWQPRRASALFGSNLGWKVCWAPGAVQDSLLPCAHKVDIFFTFGPELTKTHFHIIAALSFYHAPLIAGIVHSYRNTRRGKGAGVAYFRPLISFSTHPGTCSAQGPECDASSYAAYRLSMVRGRS